jgi:transcriptional regulator with XRE-family HTH domain
MSGETARGPSQAPKPALDTLGEALRALRQTRGWSLTDLAEASGVPISTISKIENAQMSPSLVHAINLASALEANLGFLVDRGGSALHSVVRKGRAARLDLPEMDLVLHDLQGDFARGLLEARLGEIAPEGRSGDEPMTHPGEEICYVLEGSMTYEIEGECHDLGPGDAIHFKCSAPHIWRNSAPGTTRVLWIFSDGLSF